MGNELAAIASPIDSLYFLAIQSDQLGNLRFELDGQQLIAKSQQPTANGQQPIAYVPDTHVGSPKAPVILVPVTGNPSPVTAPYKIIEDQHVVIIRNGERYDVTGKKL